MPESVTPDLAAPSVTNAAEPRSRWLTADQAAKHANVSTKCIYSSVASGRLRAARIGGRRSLRFLVSWVDTWLEAEATPIEITRGPLRVAAR